MVGQREERVPIDITVAVFKIASRMGQGQRELLGGFEQHVMAVALRLKENAYGAEIWRELNARTQRDFLGASVYASLDRLEGRRLLQAHWGEATSVKGGKAKKFYVLTELGMAALVESQRVHDAVWKGLEIKYARKRPALPRLDLRRADHEGGLGPTNFDRPKPEK